MRGYWPPFLRRAALDRVRRDCGRTTQFTDLDAAFGNWVVAGHHAPPAHVEVSETTLVTYLDGAVEAGRKLGLVLGLKLGGPAAAVIVLVALVFAVTT